MELRQLKIFCAAAQTLNFTKAAINLGYAQSNITNQIKQLEDELNIKLFDRLGRGIQLTTDGEKFWKNAAHILQLCEKAKSEFAPDVFRGNIKIGAAETLCVYRLPKLLTKYRGQYPHVEIRVQTESCNQLLNFIRDNSIDIALVLTKKISQPDLIVKTLHEEAMVVVASPLHPLAQKKAIKPGDLSGECLILTSEGCGYRPLVLSILNDYQVKTGAMMELSSVGAMKECTAAGLGVTVLPKIAVTDELERGKLIELNWQGPKLEVRTQLVYHREKWLSPAIQAFALLCQSMDK